MATTYLEDAFNKRRADQLAGSKLLGGNQLPEIAARDFAATSAEEKRQKAMTDLTDQYVRNAQAAARMAGNDIAYQASMQPKLDANGMRVPTAQDQQYNAAMAQAQADAQHIRPAAAAMIADTTLPGGSQTAAGLELSNQMQNPNWSGHMAPGIQQSEQPAGDGSKTWREKLFGPLVDANLSRYEMDPVTGQTKLRRPEGFLEGAGALLGNFGRIAGNVSMNRRTERQPGGGVGYTYGFGYDNDRSQAQLDKVRQQQLAMDATNPANMQNKAMLNAMITRDLAPVMRDAAVLSGRQTMGGYGSGGRGSSGMFDTEGPSISEQIALKRLEMDMDRYGKPSASETRYTQARQETMNKGIVEWLNATDPSAKKNLEYYLVSTYGPSASEAMKVAQEIMAPPKSPVSDAKITYQKQYEKAGVPPEIANAAASQQAAEDLSKAMPVIRSGGPEYTPGTFGKAVESATRPLTDWSNAIRRFFGSPEYSVGLSGSSTNNPAIQGAMADIETNLGPALKSISDPSARERMIQAYLAKYPNADEQNAVRYLIETAYSK